MACYKNGLFVGNMLFVMFSWKINISAVKGECSVDICHQEVPSCVDVGGRLFINSLATETEHFTLETVMRVCEGFEKCRHTEDELKQWMTEACNIASPKGIITYQCIPESSFERISNDGQPLKLNSTKNYQMFASDNLCSSPIKLLTTVPITLSIKRFTMQNSADKRCIPLNITRLPGRGKAAPELPEYFENTTTIRLNCEDCLLMNSEVWLIANVSPESSFVNHAVKAPVLFTGGRPYTAQTLRLTNVANCKRSTTASRKYQPTSMSPLGDSADMLVIITACSASSFVILVIFVVVLVYFCKKLRNRKGRPTFNNDDDRTGIYINMNPTDGTKTSVTNVQSIKYENCHIHAFSSGHNLDNAPLSEHYASCDLQIRHSKLDGGVHRHNGNLANEYLNTRSMSDSHFGSNDAVQACLSTNPLPNRIIGHLSKKGGVNGGIIHTYNIYDSCEEAVTNNTPSQPHYGNNCGPLQNGAFEV